MRVAKKKIPGLIKILEEEKARGMRRMHTLVTRNYDTDCIAFTDIDTVIEQLKVRGHIILNLRGVWDTQQNALDFSAIIGNIHDLYAMARKRENI